MQPPEYKPFGEMETPLPKIDLSEVGQLQPSQGFAKYSGREASATAGGLTREDLISERASSVNTESMSSMGDRRNQFAEVAGASHENKSTIQSLLEWSPLYRFIYPTQSVEPSSWFKWYYILPALFVFFYVIMLAESILDSRRNGKRKDQKKEGMREWGIPEEEDKSQVKGILKKMDNMERHADVNRRVSFYTSEVERVLSDESLNMYLVGAWSRMVHAILSSISIVYEWWALPWVYAVSRNAGLVR